jgi:hypothetical protein
MFVEGCIYLMSLGKLAGLDLREPMGIPPFVSISKGGS